MYLAINLFLFLILKSQKYKNNHSKIINKISFNGGTKNKVKIIMSYSKDLTARKEWMMIQMKTMKRKNKSKKLTC